jgi:hypothetical protein
MLVLNLLLKALVSMKFIQNFFNQSNPNNIYEGYIYDSTYAEMSANFHN